MPGINEGKRRRKLAVNKDKWILFKMTRTLSIAFLAFWLATWKVHKISLVKELTVWQLKVELESLHKLKFYPSVLLLMIKMSPSAREILDSYCKVAHRFSILLNPFWNHWLSLQSDWLSMVRFIHESHYFWLEITSFSQPMRMGQ